jgi:hypothetical protein
LNLSGFEIDISVIQAAHHMTLDDLPAPNTKRWVIRRKAQVVVAVRSGIISLNDACSRYNLSIEEFLSWQRLIDRHGIGGLRATRIQQYREASETH